ncbi:MAG: signal recognition particle-docking protein FtsY [Ectothiorhodospiraceae bacterium]|nr:signal recognition particle-docking protein FtsY [Chromatiales bacterium]MCP5156485.1 signal recognition particle-docking protein FtsY [Ectothiorhodospiraceae bacterium]
MLFSRNSKDPEAKPEGKPGLFGRLRNALGRTRSALVDGIAALVGGRKTIDAELVEEIETLLLSADVGVAATQRIIDGLQRRISRKEVADAEAVFRSLREDMIAILRPVAVPLDIPGDAGTFAILVVGVNGSGKTTTIGKLARRYKDAGRSVVLAAGDTFRAAAVEQLTRWGERNAVTVVAQHTGADSASVVFDALQAARARNVDVLLADTAGRLHNKAGLMDELAKVRRVMGKLDPDAPHETLLVLDGASGQNALVQAAQFQASVGVTGIAITKLDGSSKGGIVLAIAEQLKIPIRFIGVGEAAEDLRDFEPEAFVDALLAR